MKILLLLLFIPCLAVAQSGRSDTLPKIKSTLITSQQAELVNDEIKLGDKGWHYWYMDDYYRGFNEEGKMTEMREYNGEKIESYTFFDHNEQGHIVKLSFFSSGENGEKYENGYVKYFYDKNGFCYLDSAYDKNKGYTRQTKSVKDYNQNIELNKTLTNSGEFLMMGVDYYDENDELIRSEERDENNQVMNTTYYVSDTINNIETMFTLEDGDTTFYNQTGYDEQDLEIFEIECSIEEEEYVREEWTYTYEFNEFGDWYRKLVYSEGELKFVIVRTITYWN